jgi:predicted CoA-substrate-specific enzyme activase
VVDIGGQDNKVITIGADGRREHFKMNRKCAAGTGAFLEEIALRLGLPPSELERLAGGAGEAVRLSSFCTVFAKTEILSHLARGVPVTEIVRGAFHSVVARIVEMDPLEGEVVMTGGVVAHNPTVAAILAERIGRPVAIAPDPQFVGALGAALVACRNARQSDGGALDAGRSL